MKCVAFTVPQVGVKLPRAALEMANTLPEMARHGEKLFKPDLMTVHLSPDPNRMGRTKRTSKGKLSGIREESKNARIKIGPLDPPCRK